MIAISINTNDPTLFAAIKSHAETNKGTYTTSATMVNTAGMSASVIKPTTDNFSYKPES